MVSCNVCTLVEGNDIVMLRVLNLMPRKPMLEVGSTVLSSAIDIPNFKHKVPKWPSVLAQWVDNCGPQKRKTSK